MNLATRIRSLTTIADVTGHIDLSNSPALRKTLLATLKDSDRLALNLAQVNYIDSSGIASLLEVLKEARRTGKKFVLFGLTTAVREVLQLTRLTRVFEIYENEDAAVETASGQGTKRP
jgi:anti-sigma B factor antagonist